MQVMLRFFVCPKCKKESEVLFHTFQWVDEKGFKPPQCDENAEYKDDFIYCKNCGVRMKEKLSAFSVGEKIISVANKIESFIKSLFK